MQILQKWPDTLEGVSAALTITLQSHLAEPFDNDTQAAQKFWQQYPSTLIVIHSDSDIQNVDEENQTLINFALECAEYTDSLTDEYRINLAILNDEGIGVYLVYPQGFDFKVIRVNK